MKFDIKKINDEINDKLQRVYDLQERVDDIMVERERLLRYMGALNTIGPFYRYGFLDTLDNYEVLLVNSSDIRRTYSLNVEDELGYVRLKTLEKISAFPENIDEVEYEGYDVNIDGVSRKDAFVILGKRGLWNDYFTSINERVDVFFRTGDYFDKWNTVVIEQVPSIVVKVNNVMGGGHLISSPDSLFPFVFQIGENVNTSMVSINTSLTGFGDSYYMGFRMIDVQYRSYIGHGSFEFDYTFRNDISETTTVDVIKYTPPDTYVRVKMIYDTWEWDSSLSGALDRPFDAGDTIHVIVDLESSNRYLTPLFMGLIFELS